MERQGPTQRNDKDRQTQKHPSSLDETLQIILGMLGRSHPVPETEQVIDAVLVRVVVVTPLLPVLPERGAPPTGATTATAPCLTSFERPSQEHQTPQEENSNGGPPS